MGYEGRLVFVFGLLWLWDWIIGAERGPAQSLWPAAKRRDVSFCFRFPVPCCYFGLSVSPKMPCNRA